MIITKAGVDIINVVDSDFTENNIFSTEKVHLIKLLFDEPTDEKVDWVLKSYPMTNRFIIQDNIKFYNWYFKNNNKKYYVENGYNAGLISFFKKNNKVLLNFHKLRYDIKAFIMRNYIFRDLLKNLEIIEMSSDDFEEKADVLSNWNGNVVIS